MRKCGQRGGLTVRLEGFLRHPPPWWRGGPLFRHQTARGGATAHPLPGACVSTSERPDTGAVISVRWKCSYKAAGRSRPPGLCHPRARWRPLRSYGRDAGRRTGDSFVASHAHLVNRFSSIYAAGGPPVGAAGARPLCVTLTATGAGGPVDGATGACPLSATGGVIARESLRMAPQVPVPPCRLLLPALGLSDMTGRMIEVRVGCRTRTAHGTTYGNYPLPCPRCSLPRPLCSPNAEHAHVSLVAPSLCSG